MAYDVKIVRVPPQILAVSRDRATMAELPAKIIARLNDVWNFVKGPSAGSVKSDGHNIVVYHDEVDRSLLFTPEGVPIEPGARVLAPFTPPPEAGNIVCTTIPACTAATTIHIGPYKRLGEAHMAVRSFCKSNGHPITGTNWELYDHPSDDETKLRTDVFYVLR